MGVAIAYKIYKRLGDPVWATPSGRPRLGDPVWATPSGRPRLGDPVWATPSLRGVPTIIFCWTILTDEAISFISPNTYKMERGGSVYIIMPEKDKLKLAPDKKRLI